MEFRKAYLSFLLVAASGCGSLSDEHASATVDTAASHDALGNRAYEFRGVTGAPALDTAQNAASTACKIWRPGFAEGSGASCVLVARNMVLTAAHTVNGFAGGDIKVFFPRSTSLPWPETTDPAAGTAYSICSVPA